MQGAIRRLLENVGDGVTLYQYEQTTSGSRGTAYTLAEADGTPVTMIPDPGRKSLGFNAAFGADVEVDMVFLASAEYDIDDGGGEGASRIEHAGRIYAVVDADRSFSETHGLQLLECNLDSESDLA